MLEPWIALPSFLAAMIAGALAGILMLGRRVVPASRLLGGVLLATVVIQLGHTLALLAPVGLLPWRRLALLGELAQALLIYLFGMRLLRSLSDLPAPARRGRLALALAGALLGVAATLTSGLRTVGPLLPIPTVTLGFSGRLTLVYLLVQLVLGLAQLEQVLRGSRDPLRYHLKFTLIGVAGLAGYGVYETSQFLLLPIWRLDLAFGSGLVTLLALALVAFGLRRARRGEVKGRLSLSPQVVYGSITFLVVGVYLVGIGLLAELIGRTGRQLHTGLAVLVVFAGLVALTILVSSRRARARLRAAIGRHLYRARHDYRRKWLEVTGAFRDTAAVEAILDQLVELLSRTFAAGHISLWMRSPADGRYHQVRSINVEAPPSPLGDDHPVIARLRESAEPIRIADSGSSDFQADSRGELAMPLGTSARGLIAFIVLGRDLDGGPYGTDDAELLKAIAHHVGVLLAHAQLAAENKASAELRALHQFSAFCIHDLKNLAARLSLVTQNAETHGQDPEFQASAMRTVSTTVQRMTALIAKLSARTAPPAHEREGDTDLGVALAEAASAVKAGVRVVLPPLPEGSARVAFGKEHLGQVLLNLVLNAQQAMAGSGQISVEVHGADGRQVVKISDDGPGISPERLQVLFQPFQSDKPGGLGVGLYQCRSLVEAAGGTLTLTSEVGRGTTVQLVLPAARTELTARAGAG